MSLQPRAPPSTPRWHSHSPSVRKGCTARPSSDPSSAGHCCRSAVTGPAATAVAWWRMGTAPPPPGRDSRTTVAAGTRAPAVHGPPRPTAPAQVQPRVGHHKPGGHPWPRPHSRPHPLKHPPERGHTHHRWPPACTRCSHHHTATTPSSTAPPAPRPPLGPTHHHHATIASTAPPPSGEWCCCVRRIPAPPSPWEVPARCLPAARCRHGAGEQGGEGGARARDHQRGWASPYRAAHASRARTRVAAGGGVAAPRRRHRRRRVGSEGLWEEDGVEGGRLHPRQRLPRLCVSDGGDADNKRKREKGNHEQTRGGGKHSE